MTAPFTTIRPPFQSGNGMSMETALLLAMAEQSADGTKAKWTIEEIIAKVSDHTGISINRILSPTRKREVVEARHLAMKLSREHTNHTQAYIGKSIGGRDHCTVIHACRNIDNLLQHYPHYTKLYQQINEALSN